MPLNKQTSQQPSHGAEGLRSAPVKQRTLSVPVLLVTLGVIALGGVLLYFWHGLQVKRGAAALLEKATTLKGDEEFSAAASYLFRYTQLQPDDLTARIELAEVYGKGVKDSGRIDRAA
jgi:hypothetical protein